MNTWGGPRPNAGRKTKAERHGTAIDQAEDKVCDHLPALVNHMLQLAYGIKLAKKTPQGGEIIYKTPPNFKALAYLIDRILGKATQSVEMSGPDGGSLSVEFEERMQQALDKVYGPSTDDAEYAAQALNMVNKLNVKEESMN